jgi:hypothetical protein
MADKPFRFGPVALTNVTTTNILNGPVQAAAGTGIGAQNIRMILTHIRIVNKHASVAAKFSLYIGATGANAAGTEFMGTLRAVPVGGPPEDWYGRLPLDAADFLVGGADTATALTIEGEGLLVVL